MRIALVVCYFGEWPPWFPAYLQSCRHNTGVDWLIITDIPVPPDTPPNVYFISSTLQDIQQLATNKLGFNVALNRPYKLCDLRPAYGIVFEDLLREYDFWGHADLDIVWGDIRAFITGSILCEHDILSARKGKICGHFSLFRNDDRVNTLFQEDALFPEYMQRDRPFYYDEVGMTHLINEHAKTRQLRIFWPRFLLNFAEENTSRSPSRLGAYVNRWYWERGKLYERSDTLREVMYLHFMTWKNSLQNCTFGYGDFPDSFYISYSHIGQNENDRAPGGVLAQARRWMTVS